MLPTALIGGQSVWVGCGSEVTLWPRPLLLTNVTLCPTLMVTEAGVTRPSAMVIVAPLGPGPLLPGAVGVPSPPPPHAASPTSNPAATTGPVIHPAARVIQPPWIGRPREFT